jgi:hypothetical protein
MFNFEELDDTTRQWMLEEFIKERDSGSPYLSPWLSEMGHEAFPEAMENAIRDGLDETLAFDINHPSYWLSHDPAGKVISPFEHPKRLAASEFNTWYVRGLARKLMEEGETECQVYRADTSKGEPCDKCRQMEGRLYPLAEVYEGHRAAYWPNPDPYALSIPAHEGCRCSIRRVPKDAV